MTRMCWLWVFMCLMGCSSTSSVSKEQKVEIAESRMRLGLGYLEQGQWLRARQNLEAAVMLNPKSESAHMGLAYYLQQVGEDDAAHVHYKEALSLSPDDPDILNNYGTFLCHIERYADAESAFLAAVAQPGYYLLSASYENAGLCALKAGDHLNAKKWFNKAVNHEPNRYLSTLYLVEIDIKENAFGHALQRLNSFHQQHGYQAASLFAMLKISHKQAKQEQVDTYARLLVEQFPQSQEYRQYLANEY